MKHLLTKKFNTFSFIRQLVLFLFCKLTSVLSFAQCNPPTSLTAGNITTTSFSVSWITPSWDYGLLEYGPTGFTPGTGATPGTNGTTVIVTSGSKTLTGLSPGTAYDVYIRSHCTIGTTQSYSVNSASLFVRTAYCPQSFTYGSLGSLITFNYNGRGIWDNYDIFHPGLYGQETFVKFTPPSTGYYKLSVSYTNSHYPDYEVALRTSGVCDISGITNINNSGNTGNYLIGPLNSGVTYDLIFDTPDSTVDWIVRSFSVGISCPQPSGLSFSNIQPTSMNAAWSCNCSNTYLEYGPSGFTPGTNASAGVNGTVIANATSPYTIAGLSPNTVYDVYARSNCGGSFSANTAVVTRRTALDCSTAQVITCGSEVTYQSLYLQKGAWDNYGCGTNGNDAIENIFSFTPTQNGFHSILVYGEFANSSGYTYVTRYYSKVASGSCNETGWSCLGSDTIFPGPIFNSTRIPLGNLTAGITYLILVDAINNFQSSQRNYFRIECPNVCYTPVINRITTTNTSATLSTCSTCFGNVVLEYGLHGFTPSTDSLAGVGGNVISNVTFPYTINGLASGTTYDLYVRQNCTSLNSYSPNSSAYLFTTTCSTSPSSISLSNSPVCIGGTVTLTEVGGVLAAGGNYRWYTGSCGGTLVGTGPSISISPTTSGYYYVRAEASCGNTPCDSVYVPFSVPTAQINASGATTFCSGSSVLLSANSGSGLTYQWKLNGGVIAGATSRLYTATASGNYVCIVTNTCGDSASNSISVTANSPPSITQQPSNSFVCAFGNTSFSLIASGTGLTYQWKANGTNITDGTNYNGTNTSLLNITSAPPTFDLNQYTCTVSGTCLPSVTTFPVTLSVGSANPSIMISGPSSICAGATANFNVTAIMGAGLNPTYQWKVNGTNVGVTNSFSYSSASLLSGDVVTCILTTNDFCSNNAVGVSNPITVTVNMLPAVISAAGSTNFCNGNSVTLNANTGTGLSYQWRLGGVDIPQANSFSYVASTPGDYTCVVTNSCGSSTSNTITVIVNTLPSASINASGSTTFCSGSSVTLNANTGTGLSYQWQLNGTNISLATASAYIATVAGNYTCMVTNSCGNATSNTITTILTPLPSASINASGSTTFCSGSSVTLSANTGTGLNYQWQLNGTNISLATASSYLATVAGNYTCVVTNSCGNISSNAIAVIVNSAPTAVISAVGSPTNCSGTSVTLNANTGNGLSYQWKLNGTTISFATSSSYAASAAGNYSCVVTNACGSTTSNTIVVAISFIPTATISAASTVICSGTTVLLSANTGPGFTYQWKRNGTTIAGATFSNYSATIAGAYTCTESNTCGSSTSNSITIIQGPSVPSRPGNITGVNNPCAGANGIIYSISAVSGATSYQWVVPALTTIASGQGTTSITVNFAANFSSGNIGVSAVNICGTSARKDKSIAARRNCTPRLKEGSDPDFDVDVFPNPTHEHFTIKISSPDKNSCLLILTDLLGREVERRENISSDESFEFGYHLTNGIYFVEVIQGDSRKVLRLIKSE